MNVILRNFFRLLRSGALNDAEAIEPMSDFKWNRLWQMVTFQHVEGYAVEGVNRTDDARLMNKFATLYESDPMKGKSNLRFVMSNGLLNRRLKKIAYNERHAIDTNVESLDLLKLIVGTTDSMLNHGMMLEGLLDIGSLLRQKGDKVDFVKLDLWLRKLHLSRMAQLQGSMLIAVFDFDRDEIPFVHRIESSADKLVQRSVVHIANDTAEEWHFKQTRSGFVTNNSTLLRRNIRRSLRYLAYAPMETISNYFNSFLRSLQEIEE